MARSKDNNTDNNQDSVNTQDSVFPDGYQMNSWNDDGRELGIAASRSRMDDIRPETHYKRHKSRLDFPLHEIPHDMKYINATHTLLNEPQYDNLQELFENGYDFVKQSSHPSQVRPELFRQPDDRIRKGACIVMKKPRHIYESEQRAIQEESTRRQKDVMASTDFGTPTGQPKFIVENNGSYTPNYSNKRY